MRQADLFEEALDAVATTTETETKPVVAPTHKIKVGIPIGGKSVASRCLS